MVTGHAAVKMLLSRLQQRDHNNSSSLTPHKKAFFFNVKYDWKTASMEGMSLMSHVPPPPHLVAKLTNKQIAPTCPSNGVIHNDLGYLQHQLTNDQTSVK